MKKTNEMKEVINNEVITKKEFTVSQLCDLIKIVPQYLYKVLNKPEEGKIYTKDSINYTELKKLILRKFDNNMNEIKEVFNINTLDEIEIVKSSKLSSNNINKIDIDELEIEQKYILRSYHYEVEVILKKIDEIDDNTIYVFESLKESKNNQCKYKIFTKEELENDRFTIKKNEE